MFKVTVRVVETMVGTAGFKTMDDVIEWIVDHMIVMTGGATVDGVSMGYWKDDAGTIVKERGHNVWTLVNKDGWQVGNLKHLCHDLKAMTGQDCILFMVEDMDKVEFV